MRHRPTQLDWTQNLLPQVAGKLRDLGANERDLSNLLVVVPTVQAGRRLRENLVLSISGERRGLLAPDIKTPDHLLADNLRSLPVASEPFVLSAWASVLRGIDLSHFQALFPLQPEQTTAWQLGMAQRFVQIKKELGTEGLGFAEVAQTCSEKGIEPDRWHQLARLEGLYLSILKQAKRLDPEQARRDAANQYRPPKQIDRIVLAATPDPQAIPLRALEQAANYCDLEIWVYGPDLTLFDDWGRPVTERWVQRELDFEEWACRFSTTLSPKETAQSIAERVVGNPVESVLIGLIDTTLNPVVADALRSKNISTYDPEGKALFLSSPGRLAELLCELSEASTVRTLRSLFQHPHLYQWLSSKTSQDELLKAYDHLFQKHLCADLDGFMRFAKSPELKTALQQLHNLKQMLEHADGFAVNLSVALQQIYRNKSISNDQFSAQWCESARSLKELIDSIREAKLRFHDLPNGFSIKLLQQALKQNKIYPDRAKDAHDLLGWLELLWNDAPYLILAGMNEGLVPENVVGDAFLPESLRETLGLRTNAQRLARDAYLLEALCRRRASNGRIDCIIHHSASDGSPLKPSRLLFLGHESTLLSRTRKLFATPENPQLTFDQQTAWKLKPPKQLARPDSFSVTALKNYLECPFRFFLRHILGMQAIDVESREFTPATFGNLFHDSAASLEGMTLDHSFEVEDFSQRLQHRAKQLLQERYGESRSFALRLQEEALMARIEAFAASQQEDIQKGESIQISNTEVDFEIPLEGFMIRGRIDRIDQRDGRTELIDYKTSDQAKSPEKAHLKTIRRKEAPAHLPKEAFFEHEGKSYRWIDLQLPLYVIAQTKANQSRPTIGYVNLPKTADKASFERWDDFSKNHLESAHACACAILRQIRSGLFWPPNQDPEFDEYAWLFPDGIENSVDGDSFRNYEFEGKDIPCKH